MHHGLDYFRFLSIMVTMHEDVNSVEQSPIIRSPRAIKRQKTGGNFCCVVDCSNSSEKDKNKGEKNDHIIGFWRRTVSNSTCGLTKFAEQIGLTNRGTEYAQNTLKR